ncbi:MAG: AAA family ATPase [Acidobacteria bacterium]|nr:AAA family ATPase [Acidobacteriota bacterium]
MGHVIVIANQKGGCGKTTIALGLAGILGEEGLEALLVDADPQGSVVRWRGVRSEGSIPFHVVAMPAPILHAEVPKLRHKYDMILIDCPPGGPAGAESITRSALAVADLVLVPIQPSAFDLWSGEGMAEMIARARSSNAGLRAYIVISRRIVGTAIGDEAREAARSIGLPVCRAEIAQRVALAEASVAGRTVSGLAPHSAATKELRLLVKELRKCLSA